MGGIRIIGLDTSIAACGIAVYGQDRPDAKPYMDAVTVTTPENAPTERRMQLISAQLWRVAGSGPSAVNTFAIFERPIAFNSGDTTLKLGGIYWLLRYGLAVRGIPRTAVGLEKVKLYATGMGNAGKAIVTEAANYHLRHLTHAGDDNQADALWLAAMAAHRYLGRPLHHGTTTHSTGKVLESIKNWPQWTPWP